MDPFDLLTQYLAHRDAMSPPLDDEAPAHEPPAAERPIETVVCDQEIQQPDPQRRIA